MKDPNNKANLAFAEKLLKKAEGWIAHLLQQGKPLDTWPKILELWIELGKASKDADLVEKK